MAAFRISVSAIRRIGMAAVAHANQSADLWRGGFAEFALPGRTGGVAVIDLHGSVGGLYARHVRRGFCNGEPAQHQAGGVTLRKFLDWSLDR